MPGRQQVVTNEIPAGCLLASVLFGCTPAPEESAPRILFPDADALLQASRLELLTLDPMEALVQGKDTNRFDSYRVLGRATLDMTERQALITALESAIERADSRETKCEFMPHHALHADTAPAEIDVAICFTCGEAYVYRDGRRSTHYRIAAGRDATVEAIVDRHGLPRAEHAP